MALLLLVARLKNLLIHQVFPGALSFFELTPGTIEFSQKWKDIVLENMTEFVEVEHAFIKETHFDIQIEYIKSQAGIDLRYHSHALNDVVWSVSVQHGPSTNVISKAMHNLDIPAIETKEYDKLLIDAIYDERGKKDSQGRIIRFINSSIAQQNGVSQRYISERATAQEELKNEKDY